MQCTTCKVLQPQEVDLGGLGHGHEVLSSLSSGLDVKLFSLLLILTEVTIFSSQQKFVLKLRSGAHAIVSSCIKVTQN